MEANGTALVMRSAGSSYTLRDNLSGEVFEAVLRGRLRLKGVRSTNPVAVGDIVFYQTDEYGEHTVTDIRQRINYIIRRSSNLSKESHILAANIDQAAIVVTLFEPATNPEFIDRFLVTCEAYGIPASIIINKTDLAIQVPGALEMFREIYRPAGYPIIEVSATRGDNMEVLSSYVVGKTTLLAGNSGVGKSSLILSLIPGADVRTGDISDYHRKGKHTTTFARMYELPAGGFIIDTPGIKGFGLIDIEPGELSRYFPEMMEYSPSCQYYNCTHVHEPGCAVMQAVEKEIIPQERYISYLKMLEDHDKYRK